MIDKNRFSNNLLTALAAATKMLEENWMPGVNNILCGKFRLFAPTEIPYLNGAKKITVGKAGERTSTTPVSEFAMKLDGGNLNELTYAINAYLWQRLGGKRTSASVEMPNVELPSGRRPVTRLPEIPPSGDQAGWSATSNPGTVIDVPGQLPRAPGSGPQHQLGPSSPQLLPGKE